MFGFIVLTSDCVPNRHRDDLSHVRTILCAEYASDLSLSAIDAEI